MGDSARHRTMLKQLYAEQEGKCCYCNCDCKFYPPEQLDNKSYPHDLATLEHLFDRFDIRRWAKHQGDGVEAHKMACYKCNTTRGFERNILMESKVEFFDIKQNLTCSKRKRIKGKAQ